MPIVEGDVATPMEQKGLIMRTLMEQLADEGAELVLVDGIKVVSDQGWAFVVPDPADPVTHVWAEGSDPWRPKPWWRRTSSGSPGCCPDVGAAARPVVRYGRPP